MGQHPRAGGRDEDGNDYNDDLHGWDFVTDTADIIDVQGHGTAVAGIIAAEGNNAAGVAGVMWRAGLMSLRVLDQNGTGDVASAVEAIDYATLNGAQVINCSWGTEHQSSALSEAIGRASKRGVVVVASAGNGGRDLETTARYPASYEMPNLISVASTAGADQLASFSNWGARHVAMAAPGSEILTTKRGGDYQAVSGSSASAAFVAGVAGLVKTLRPWLNADRTREMVLNGVRPVPSLSDKVVSKGVVSAAGALSLLDALPPAEGLDVDSGNNGGERGTDAAGGESTRSTQTGGRASNINPDRVRTGDEFRVTPPAPTQGAPGSGLPNLNELRQKQPVSPKAADPIPSTRCPHKDPDCTAESRKASPESPTGLIAWGADASFTESPVADGSRPVSDSPFRLFWSAPALSPAPRPLPQSARTNFALASNGGVATASSNTPTSEGDYHVGSLVNGDRKGLNFGQGEGWRDGNDSFPDWVQVDLAGSRSIYEINVVTVQDAYTAPTEPTEIQTFSLYGVTAFDVQYWNGTGWATVTGGSVTGNNKVWRKFTFPAVTTTKVRVLINNALYSRSRLTEVEAWGPEAAPRVNVALAANGSVATASSTTPASEGSYPPASVINGDRRGTGFGQGGGWRDATEGAYPDWVQVNFNGSKVIDEIDVVTVQDDYAAPTEPTDGQTFSLYGATAFDVQYWDGSVWVTVPGGSVTGNGKVWKKFTFPSVTTGKVRVLVNNALYGRSRIVEVEAWGTSVIPSYDPSGNNYSRARLDDYNRAGSGGVDLLSGNANWSLPILGLKGRAGLDLGLSLSYNSLVWTKDPGSNTVKFDADEGTPSPGFRLGFPVIQSPYYDSQLGRNVYLLVTPSGSRVELRQVGTTNVYEAGDSSYLQLTTAGGVMTLRPRTALSSPTPSITGSTTARRSRTETATTFP